MNGGWALACGGFAAAAFYAYALDAEIAALFYAGGFLVSLVALHRDRGPDYTEDA